MKTPLIMRTYRITREQDKALKLIAKKHGWGEGELLREAIDKLIAESRLSSLLTK